MGLLRYVCILSLSLPGHLVFGGCCIYLFVMMR